MWDPDEQSGDMKGQMMNSYDDFDYDDETEYADDDDCCEDQIATGECDCWDIDWFGGDPRYPHVQGFVPARD